MLEYEHRSQDAVHFLCIIKYMVFSCISSIILSISNATVSSYASTIIAADLHMNMTRIC